MSMRASSHSQHFASMQGSSAALMAELFGSDDEACNRNSPPDQQQQLPVKRQKLEDALDEPNAHVCVGHEQHARRVLVSALRAGAAKPVPPTLQLVDEEPSAVPGMNLSLENGRLNPAKAMGPIKFLLVIFPFIFIY